MLAALQSQGWVTPPGQVTGSLNQNIPIQSQNLNLLGYFLLDYLLNMGLHLAVIKIEINTFQRRLNLLGNSV